MDSSIECPTPTTPCDLDDERQCKRKLKTFLKQIISFVDEMKAFFELEVKAVILLWNMSVKLRELDTKKHLPKYKTAEAEEAYQDHLSDLNEIFQNHDKRLHDCEKELDPLHESYRNFERSCTKLDWDSGVEIIKGNPFQKPLCYYLEQGERVIFEARFLLINLRTVFNAIKINDCTTVEEYKKAFRAAEDFLNLLNEYYVFASIFVNRNKRV